MAFSWDDPSWVGDLITGVIGIVGIVIAILQYQISQTQTEILAEQRQLRAQVTRLNTDLTAQVTNLNTEVRAISKVAASSISKVAASYPPPP